MFGTHPAVCTFCERPVYNLLGQWRHIGSNVDRCPNGISKATPLRKKARS